MVDGPPVVADEKISENDVLVDVGALAEAFFQGMSSFVLEISDDEKRAAVVKERAQKLLVAIPWGSA